MKKVLLSVALVFAVCAASSVMAQDAKKCDSAQKTECAKECSNKNKSDDKKCATATDKKCCKDDKQATKKCCKDDKQASTGKKKK